MTGLQAIVKGCIANEVRYQLLFYERFYNYAYKIAFRYIWRYESVANVVNDGIANLFQGIKELTGITDVDEPLVLAWVKKIIVKTIIKELQRNNLAGEFARGPAFAWKNCECYKNKEKLLLYKELIMHLKTLAPAYNLVFNMYVIDGFSHKEIAAQLHITEANSKLNLSKARACLEKLGKNQPVYSAALSL